MAPDTPPPRPTTDPPGTLRLALLAALILAPVALMVGVLLREEPAAPLPEPAEKVRKKPEKKRSSQGAPDPGPTPDPTLVDPASTDTRQDRTRAREDRGRSKVTTVEHDPGRTRPDGGSRSFTSVQGQAETCVRNMAWEQYPEGWAVRTITTAQLGEMEHRIYMLTLYAGNSYRILACGDKGVQQMDLVLYDADGKLLLQDTTLSRQPVIYYRPEQTDTHYVAVHMMELVEGAEGTFDACLAVTYK